MNWSLPALRTLHITHCELPLMYLNNSTALTSVHLEEVTLVGEKSLSFEGFACLKNLTLVKCTFWYDLEVFSITSLSLAKLAITNGESINCMFMISAPNLSCFEYSGCSPLFISAKDGFPCLEQVNIDINVKHYDLRKHWIGKKQVISATLTNESPLCIFSSPSLKILRLNMASLCNWICNSPQSSLWNLQSLTTLHLSCSILPDLPWSSPVLTILRLTGCQIPVMSWILQALKTLILDKVKFLRDKSISFEGFVHLKNLTLMGCTTLCGMEAFSITSFNLTNLTISEDFRESLGCRFLVSAPKLSCLECSAFSPLLSSKDGFPCLEKVIIDICRGNYQWKNYLEEQKQVIFQQLITLFEEIRGAKFLTLSFSTIKLLSRITDFSDYKPSPFGNLKCFKLQNSPLRPERSNIFANRVILYLLSNSPDATILLQSVDGIIRDYNPKVNMLCWMGSSYSIVEYEDSSSDDEYLASSNGGHVSDAVDYSGDEVEKQKTLHSDEEQKVEDGHLSAGRDEETMVQDTMEEPVEEDHRREDPEPETKLVHMNGAAMHVVHKVVSPAIVHAGVNDQAYSYNANNNFSLWEGHQVYSEFVDLL